MQSAALELDALAAPLGYTVTHTGDAEGSYTLKALDGYQVVIITPHADDVRNEIDLLDKSDVWELKRGEHVAASSLSAVVDVDGTPHTVSGEMVIRSVGGGSIVLTRTGDEPNPRGAWTKAPVRRKAIIRVE
ncbi:hypothetical protein [Rhodococcus sp. IEGM 1330]|uniref:hypothetical protein n=1 Tax=Rhodococcus sp. IEGM 1330 TaxID=3082225 RepID=UPI00295582B0|nr:hypothetical protein [Rhodococcus sp. IEGM 1330]MDV8023394.1 hypothetical protein [Rhodococcus sp. IEGM 1330]